MVEPQAAPLVAVETRSSPVLRDDDGGESHAPAFLKAPTTTPRAPRAPKAETPAAAASTDEAPAKPKRRRAPRSFEGGEGGPPSETEDA